MRPFRTLLVFLVAISAAASAGAQGLPRGIEALRQRATTRTEFTLDHTMLVIASRLDSGDDDLRWPRNTA